MVCDYINSEERVNWDVGGLTLLMIHRDILKYAVAIIDDEIWDKHKEFFKRLQEYRNEKFPKLRILKPKGFREWVWEKSEELRIMEQGQQHF